MEVKIVLGHLFGDEGKGVTTQWLCKQAIDEGKKPIVVRFSGGPQAGHTISLNGIEHICSSYGAGTLLGVPTFIMDYFDPICAFKEQQILQRKIAEVPKLYLYNKVKFITPYDVISGISNSTILQHGTCGKGIFPTFKRYKELNSYGCGIGHILELSSKYYNMIPNKMLESEYCNSFWQLDWDFVRDIPDKFDTVIFEGSQGLLLDMERGFMPHCTPSKVGLNGISEKYLQDAEVYLVTRTYLTRHGNGYEPCYPITFDLSNVRETNVHNKFQGEFKVGQMEYGLINKAYERHCLDNYKVTYNCKFNLVVTHIDCCPYWKAEVDRISSCYPKEFISNVYINDSMESNIKLYD